MLLELVGDRARQQRGMVLHGYDQGCDAAQVQLGRVGACQQRQRVVEDQHRLFHDDVIELEAVARLQLQILA